MEFRKPFKVITSDDVANQMNQVIVRVNEALHVSKIVVYDNFLRISGILSIDF